MNPSSRLLPCANRHKGARDVPHHMMEKRVCLHVYYDKIALAGYRNPLHITDWCTGLAARRLERRKVMLPQQRLCGFMHAFSIKRTEGPADLTALDAGSNRVIIDNVAITPIDGREAGVEIFSAITGPMNRNITGQGSIDAHDPGAKVPDRRGFKVRNLVAGMDAGIGSSGTNQINGMIRHFCNSPCQVRFYRAHPGFLLLPAMKVAPIVFERNGDPTVTNFITRGELLRFEEQAPIRKRSY